MWNVTNISTLAINPVIRITLSSSRLSAPRYMNGGKSASAVWVCTLCHRDQCIQHTRINRANQRNAQPGSGKRSAFVRQAIDLAEIVIQALALRIAASGNKTAKQARVLPGYAAHLA